jgi:hypothetical protein
MWTKLEESHHIRFECRSYPALLLGAVQLGRSQETDATTTSMVETASNEPLGGTIRCTEPSHRSKPSGAIADSGSEMPHPGLKAHLSTLAVGSLVFAFHPTPIAFAVPAEDGVKKGYRSIFSDAVDIHPRDESEGLP